jgi:ABC-type phosphate transport system substrate-binding protein
MKVKYALIAVILIIALISIIFLSQPSTEGRLTLNGAGATFPQPFLDSTIQTYTTQVKENIQINYQGVGSGAGINA